MESRFLFAVVQCESLRYTLLGGLAIRRECCGVLQFVMESATKGHEVVVPGKLELLVPSRCDLTITDGFMIHSGQPARES